MALFTGLQASELRGLTWANVHLDQRVLHVTQRADRFNVIGLPKSKAGTREVLLPPMVVNALREWKLACPRGKDGKPGLVFPTSAGTVETLANIWNRGLKPLQMATGMVDGQGRAKYGLHSLRHFYASWIIDQGFPPKRVQSLLGHASIQMTFDRYGHLFPAGQDDHARLAAGELSLLRSKDAATA